MRAPDWLTARPVAHRGLHDIARGIVRLAGDAPLRARLAGAGAAQAQQFNWDVAAARYQALFARIEAAKRRPEA